MTEPVQLAIPCRTVTLTVEVGPRDGLTVLEDLVAQALLVSRGEHDAEPTDRQHNVDSLAELFAAPYRIMLDVLHTLWSKGHIYIDFDTGRIDLADASREMLTRNGALDSVAVQRQKRVLLFEPVTGRLFDARVGARRPREGSLQMPRQAGIDERDLSQAELLRAVQRVLRRERQRGTGKNVRTVGFDNPVLRPGAEDRWLHATADVRLDPASERVSARLRDDVQWGRRAIRVLSDYLADLADREPDHPFVRSLRGRAKRELVPAESVEHLLLNMAKTVAGLGDTEPGQIELRQTRLMGLAAGIRRGLAELAQARASTTVVSRSAGHRWTIEDLLATAKDQVVIIAPQIRYSTMNPLLPTLREALDRGVHVVILWGRAPDDSLEAKVYSAFAELSGRPGASLLIADRSAKVAASVMIQDDSRALMGSRSLLAIDLAGNRGDVGVLVGPAAGGSDQPAVVTDLLRWARDSFPHWARSRQIKVLTEDFRPKQADRPPAQPGDWELPPLDQDRDAPALRLWADSWAACHVALAQELARLRAGGPIVEVVAGGAQYDVMWEAIRAATHDIVICADSIDPSAAIGPMVRVLDERATAGVTVQIVQPEDPGSAATTPLSQLAADHEGIVRILRRPAAARLVVTDQETVIGSFSPLGDPVRDTIKPWRRSRQLGLRITDAGFAGQIASAVGRSFEVRPDLATPIPPDIDPIRHGRSAARTILMEARQQRLGGQFGEVVAGRLSQVADPWLVPQIWLEMGVPSDEIRPAAAALVRDAESMPAAERATWVNWLIEDAWQRWAFVEAAVLSGLAGAGAGSGIPPTACVAAAALEIGPVGRALADAALELSYTELPAQVGGAAGALAEILLWAGTDGVDAVALLRESLSEPWRAVADHAVSLGGSENPPASLFEVVHELSSSAAMADARQRWADLATEVEKVRRLRQRFAFTSGRVMHDGLFAQDGLLAAIRAASVGGDAEFTALSAVLPSDVRRYLDSLVARADAEPIEWSRQQSFLTKIDRIVRNARRLVASHAGGQSDTHMDTALAPYRDIADLVAATWNALYSDARAAPPPHSFALLALLDKLAPLTMWARTRS